MKFISTSIVFILLFITSCNQNNNSSPKDFSALFSKMNTKVKAGDDFFEYSNGKWIQQHPIPASEASFGVWNMVEDTVAVYLNTICKNAQNAHAKTGSNEQKIADFYSSFMDTISVEKQGIQAIQPWLTEINHIKTPADVVAQLHKLHAHGINPIFDFYVSQDDKNSAQYITSLYQGGIGLPDRDYYFNTDKQSAETREKYKLHIQKMFELLRGNNNTKTNSIYALEEYLAKNSRKMEDLRDPYKNYNKMAFAELGKKIPNMDFINWEKTVGFSTIDSINVGQPEFFNAASQALTKFDIQTWRDYLTWNLVNGLANYLPAPFEKEHFNFYSKELNGVSEQKPRWKRALRLMNNYLGEALGQKFVEKHFDENAKKQTEEMVKSMIEVYKERVRNLEWMSAETKQKAILKLDNLMLKLGYPSKWRDYSNYTVSKNLIENILNGNKHELKYNISQLGKPVDRTKWGMTPQTYNAYYNPSNNEIVFPAAILMIPGSKDIQNDIAIQYGFIGATIGHEITHGLDDQGAQYDEKGNLNNWWTAEDKKKFDIATKLMIDQYNGYSVGDGKFVNGSATLGENIADLGGTIIAYKAFEKTKYAQDTTKINGFTPAQRFFLAYSYSWMQFPRPEYLKNQVMSDVHSPVIFRVNGTLANMPEFYKAFQVQPNEKLYRQPDMLVKIW